MAHNLQTMKLKSLTLLTASLLILTGCASATSEAPVQEDSAYSSSEQMFAQMMIPHHEQAVEMAELAETRTQNPEVLEIAAKIKAGQEPEIVLMETWVLDEGGHDSHAGHGGMDGMLSEDELEQLSQASGSEFDKLFLEGMIKHHEGALDMLVMLEGSENEVVIGLKDKIRTAQEAEIAEMKALLASY